MVAKRIIPCLDIKGGRTVKGVKFENLRDAGDPVELAKRYCQEGADELVFLDISATDEDRGTTLAVVRKVAAVLDIPFTVGGGISSVSGVSRLLEAGADKVSINSAAVRDPDLIDRLAREFGSQCVVVAIDSKCIHGNHEVHVQAGKIGTGRATVAWAQEACRRGAGEILLTSMDHDGTRAGFAVELTGHISSLLPIPVIASGGAGTVDDFVKLFAGSAADSAAGGHADAGLAAGIFHDKIVTIGDVKRAVRDSGVEVRL